ncbi:hypothetical protein Tco_1563468 [Tanacetum coccineum]
MRPLPSAVGLSGLLKACGTQSADVALPRELTLDLHADVAVDVACHMAPLTLPLTSGQPPLIGGPILVDWLSTVVGHR